MKKNIKVLLIVMAMLLMVTPVMAETNTIPEEAVEYSSTIIVDADGGRYQVGFVNVEFKKRFLPGIEEAMVFSTEIYAYDGEVFIEFKPDTALFAKQVHLRVDRYEGYIYDRATGKNIYVEIKKHQVLAPHFSVYCIFD